MKNTVFRIILTALTASLSLASCTKEITGGDGGPVIVDGMREFTVSFTVPTKSTPGSVDDGWQHPVFSTGDVIKVSNATESEDCTVTGSGSTAKIRTSLSGTLKAVYPSTAAILSNGTTGYITGFKVPAAQDGTFAAANICMAENIAENATSITFVNKTALFKVTPPSDVTQFTVTSLKAVVDGVARTGDAVAINSSEVVLENKVITVSNSSQTTFYVSLLPGAKLSDLSFDAGEAAGMKGIPENTIQVADNTLTAGKAYTINNSNWHPYVIIGGLKWATMDIGATSPTEAGYYFFWGGTVGYVRNSTDDGWQTSDGVALDGGFIKNNTPFYDGSSTYTKYLTEDSVLELADDAAYANWGGAWRMPTQNEFADFKDLKRGSFASGYNFGTSDSEQIFLPVTGVGNATNLTDPGDGRYWSSKNALSTTACILQFWSSTVRTASADRFKGTPIRPVADLGGFGFESYTDNGPF